MDLKREIVKVTLALLAAAVVGCGGSSEPAPKYSQIQAVYDRSCAVTTAACHGSSNPALGLDLTAGASYSKTVGRVGVVVPRMSLIAPGDPEGSYLFRKMDGTYISIPHCKSNDCGARMPMVGGFPLSADEMATFKAWIAAGAPGP